MNYKIIALVFVAVTARQSNAMDGKQDLLNSEIKKLVSSNNNKIKIKVGQLNGENQENEFTLKVKNNKDEETLSAMSGQLSYLEKLIDEKQEKEQLENFIYFKENSEKREELINRLNMMEGTYQHKDNKFVRAIVKKGKVKVKMGPIGKTTLSMNHHVLDKITFGHSPLTVKLKNNESKKVSSINCKNSYNDNFIDEQTIKGTGEALRLMFFGFYKLLENPSSENKDWVKEK